MKNFLAAIAAVGFKKINGSMYRVTVGKKDVSVYVYPDGKVDATAFGNSAHSEYWAGHANRADDFIAWFDMVT